MLECNALCELFPERHHEMMGRELTIMFPGTSVAEANRYCEDLRLQLLSEAPDVDVHQKRTDPTSMDFGASLVMALSAPAAVELAKALIAWAKRNNRAKIVIVNKEGTLVAEGLESKDVASIVRALNGK